LHTPLTDKTKNVLSGETLAKTKTGVIIVHAVGAAKGSAYWRPAFRGYAA
jgi:lactate dehydrogenase-like 2-hydroxyacid dehydrogenase